MFLYVVKFRRELVEGSLVALGSVLGVSVSACLLVELTALSGSEPASFRTSWFRKFWMPFFVAAPVIMFVSLVVFCRPIYVPFAFDHAPLLYICS